MSLEVAAVFSEETIINALRDSARPFCSSAAVGEAMRALLVNNLTNLPLPAGGRTLERWRALAAVAAVDLSLAKVYEGHTDALAILAELHGPRSAGLWAVWAAEPPQARVTFHPDENGGTLSGHKAWCSGAAVVDSAVVSAWTLDDQPILVAVSLRQPGIRIDTDGWKAVGMSASESVTVLLDARPCRDHRRAGRLCRAARFLAGRRRHRRGVVRCHGRGRTDPRRFRESRQRSARRCASGRSRYRAPFRPSAAHRDGYLDRRPPDGGRRGGSSPRASVCGGSGQ